MAKVQQKSESYSPGVFTIGGLIAYLENRDGNANVRFMQAETHRRFFDKFYIRAEWYAGLYEKVKRQTECLSTVY